MSAPNYFSMRENGMGKLLNCLPNNNQQKSSNRYGQELPPLSGNTGRFLNRNLNYSYDLQRPYVLDTEDRAATPFSDFFSESETGKILETLYIYMLLYKYLLVGLGFIILQGYLASFKDLGTDNNITPIMRNS